MAGLRSVPTPGTARPLPDILDLISRLEGEPAQSPSGARRIATLLRAGRRRDAIDRLRSSTSPTLAVIGRVLASRIRAGSPP